MYNFATNYNTQPLRNKSKNSIKFLRHNTILGSYGEKFVKQLLRDSGYKAKKPRTKRFAGDLWTFSTQTSFSARIEVKTAIESQSGTYHFCLKKDGHTDTCHSDYVILLCIDKYHSHYIYCIPCHLLVTSSLSITSHPLRYKGKYAKYRVHGQVSFEATDLVGAL